MIIITGGDLSTLEPEFTRKPVRYGVVDDHVDVHVLLVLGLLDVVVLLELLKEDLSGLDACLQQLGVG